MFNRSKIYIFTFTTYKTGFKKNVVEAMGKKNFQGFQYLKEKFPKISAVKLKERYVRRTSN